MLYAALECARILVLEGLDAAVERHRRHGAAMAAGVAGLGLATFGDPTHKMHNIVGVEIPAGIDGEAVRSRSPRASRHRDRLLLRPPPRSHLAHRHHGLQRPHRCRAPDARRARAGAARARRPRPPGRRGRGGRVRLRLMLRASTSLVTGGSVDHGKLIQRSVSRHT